MRIFRDSFSGPKRKRLLAPLLISIILHILILMLFLHKDLLKEDSKITKKDKKDYIEISEIPVQKEKETEPPEKARVLADRSHKAEEEKTIDQSTRLTRSDPQPEPQRPKSTPEPSPEPKEKQEEKVASKTAEKEVKQKTPEVKPEKKDIPEVKQPVETVKKEPDIIKKQQPKEQMKQETTREKVASVPRESTVEKKRDLSDLGKKLLRSLPSERSDPDAPPSEKKPLYGTEGPKKEDTVELSTKEFKYISYFTSLKRKIDGVWNYPEESQIRGETGRLFLEFTLNSNGDLENIQLLNSSGYSRLDNEAIRAIKVASPYNPFPDSWELEKLNIRASFEYRYSRFIR